MKKLKAFDFNGLYELTEFVRLNKIKQKDIQQITECYNSNWYHHTYTLFYWTEDKL